MKKERQKIYLAALLHDIGKFYQRASASKNKNDSNLSEQSRGIEDYICPKNKNNYYTHLHSVWTNEFFENNERVFNSIKENNENLFSVNKWTTKTDADNIANLASYHHKPQSDLQKIIQIADWWSAGIDRKDKSEDHENIEQSQLKFNSFKEVPLFSVFNILKINGEQSSNQNQNVSCQLKPLSLDRHIIFPAEIKQKDISSLQDQYSDLWKHFTDEYEKLPTDSFSGFEESLLFLLRKYTWAIPSNTMDMANVSLFDHLKTTAAIADCLYMAMNDNHYRDAFDFSGTYGKIKPGYYPVMLVGVDLSGIQSFIYDIASSKAAKSLKGRSFYLQLLAEAMLIKFKKHDQIQAKSAHVLYASGGKFYLLLPNTESVKKAIAEIKSDIEKELWKEHKGKISINISQVAFAYINKLEEKKAWIEIEESASEIKQLKDLWKLLADKITKQKEQKFKSLLIGKETFNQFFDENSEKLAVGGNVETCVVTGEEIIMKPEIKYLDNDKEKPVAKAVINQTKLGKVLKDIDFLITYRGDDEEDKYLSSKSEAGIKAMDTNFYLFDSLEIVKNDADFKKINSADVSIVNRINNTNFLAAQIKGKQISYGFQFYGGNKQAELQENVYENEKLIRKKGEEKTYQDLAKTEAGQNSLLGVLRMDIDNLGKLFIQGFDKESMSFSAYSTLSFHLDLFFSGYLNKLRDEYIEKDEEGNDKLDSFKYPIYQFKDWLNILYSGGDDLFVVGRWDKTIEFAELVRKEFAEYSKRPEIGISGGIAFVHEKFPISKAADMAGEAEKAAKNVEGKNAITFFGETVSWNIEYAIVKKNKEKFVKYITDNGLSRAILHKLIQYRQIKDKHLHNENQQPDYSFLWHTAYYLKRFREKFIPKDREPENVVNGFIKDLQEELLTSGRNNYRFYELIALSARWAEMELKYKTNDNE